VHVRLHGDNPLRSVALVGCGGLYEIGSGTPDCERMRGSLLLELEPPL
jgi:hypothetical protein